MGVVTTRTIPQLRAECDKAGIAWTETDGREVLMDQLRAKLGAFDASTEIDPMKCKDLKGKIDWTAEGAARFAGIAAYLNDAHVAEPKLDGCRGRFFLGLTGNSFNTGRRSVKTFAYIDRTDNFPHLRDAVVPELAGTILDGEILAPGSRIQTHTGTWTDSLLNASVALVNSKPEGSLATQARFGKAQFFVFDVLAVKGEDVTDRPYEERRKMLAMIVNSLQLLHPSAEIHLVDSYPATPEIIDHCLNVGFEGVVLKRKDGRYTPGKRQGEWLKVKTFSSADAFVVGWDKGTGANEGKVGSLNLAVMVPASGEDGAPTNDPNVNYDGRREWINGCLHYERAVAQVGNLTDAFRDQITDADGSLKPEFYGLVIEFFGQGVGKNGRVRHPHMTRVRIDKTPADCLVDQLDSFPKV